MPQQWNQVLYIVSAKRGATGTTAIAGAKRARLEFSLQSKVSRAGGSLLPDRVWAHAAEPKVIIETEDWNEYLTSATAPGVDETLKIEFQTGAATPLKTLTAKFGSVTRVGPSQFPPAEDAGSVPLFEIEWTIHKGTAVDTPAQAITVA